MKQDGASLKEIRKHNKVMNFEIRKETSNWLNRYCYCDTVPANYPIWSRNKVTTNFISNFQYDSKPIDLFLLQEILKSLQN